MMKEYAECVITGSKISLGWVTSLTFSLTFNYLFKVLDLAWLCHVRIVFSMLSKATRSARLAIVITVSIGVRVSKIKAKV